MFMMILLLFTFSVNAVQPLNNTNNITNTLTAFAILDCSFLKSLFEHSYNLFDQQRNNVKNNASSLYQWVTLNKLKSAVGTALFTYLFVNAYAWHIEKRLSERYCWSRWQSEKTLEELFAIQQPSLAQSLMLAIQQQYTNPTNPTDFLHPLIQFMHDTDEELKLLNNYIKLGNFVSFFYLSKLSVIDQILLSQCAERLKRLAYLKGLFLSWIAHYKLEHPVT